MAAHEHNLITGGFQRLEEEFLRRMGAARRESPLAPAVVLVPNALLRMHLARRLARSGTPHANLHFLTIRSFALRLAAERLIRERLKPLPRGMMELLVSSVTARALPDLEYFRPVAEREGFQEALLQTFRDLRDAGARPEHLDTIANRLREGEHLHQKLLDLRLLWQNVESARIERRFYDDADLLQIAAEELPASAWAAGLTALSIYGFYDLTGMQERFLKSCFAKLPATIYLPYAVGGDYAYAERALEWFREELSPCAETPLPDDAPPVDVRIISAPGDSREAEEAVREVIFSGYGPGDTHGILLRTPDYGQPIAERLSELNVEGYFTDPPSLAESVAGKSLIALAKLLGSRLRRAEVMEFIAVCPLKENPPDSLWNAISIEAGVVEGRKEWLERIAAKAAWWRRADRDPEDPEKAPDSEKADAADALLKFLVRLFDGLEASASQTTWSGASNSLASLFESMVEPSGESELALKALAEMSALDAALVPPKPEQFLRLLQEYLEAASPRSARFQANEPTVAAIEKTRGVPFDLVVLPGLVEKSFPRPARQDPILFDQERLRLREHWGIQGIRIPLPIKGRRNDEEKMLFALAIRAAKKRLVLTFPRLDSSLQRPRIPSHFLLGALERLRGHPVDYRHLETFVHADPRGRFVRLSRFESESRDHAVGAVEYGLSTFAAARRDGNPNALLYLKAETPFFERSVVSEMSRWNTVSYTEYDGVIQAGLLPGRMLYDDTHGTSPTRLEHYANCPFQYLLSYVFGIEPIQEPERTIAISPLDRGRIVHDILFDFYTGLAREERSPAGQDRDRLKSIALRRFARFEREGATGYAMMWEIEKSAILKALDLLLDDDIRRDDGFLPSFLELRFGAGHADSAESDRSSPNPAVLALPDGSETRFNGKIDRVDVNKQDALCRIIDYKTGAPRNLKKDAFLGGRALQLPVYLLAVRQMLPDLVPEKALYRHLDFGKGGRDVAFDAREWKEAQDKLAKIVATLLEGIRSGFFPARPDKQCAWCDYRQACGHGRMTEYKWPVDPRSAPLRELEATT